jgi:hypothetical protein
MSSPIAQPLVNSIGVFVTIVGAILIAVDVTRQYRGKKFEVSVGVARTDYAGSDGTPVVSGQNATETPEYKAWQKTNHRLMFWGLVSILIGGVLQIVASWL